VPHSDLEKPKNPKGIYKYWMDEIASALKREKRYRKSGAEYVDIYEGRKSDEVPFAILYSNTEVLAPAVYNARPIPIVTRRFRDADPMGKAISEVSTRALKFLIDTENQDYDNFDELIAPAVLDGLVVNRGLTRFKYSATQTSECVYGESVRWDKFLHGYARTWKKVPWIAFEWDFSKDEMEENFPGVKLDFKQMPEDSGDKDGETKEELTGVVTYKAYEIWDKTNRKVMFFSPCCPDSPLREVDDPLQLSGFFPIPKPINFMRKITTLVPTPLYEQYRQQAQELNDITRRLKAIIKAIKFRGAYNSTVEGIEKMLTADDNELVPLENMASMPENTTIDKLLYTVPVEKLAQTAQSLYQQRESVKQVIYEITGISDILRGASVASETATAQNIKNQWGTLRLKRMQKEVQRYCREALSIILEIACEKFEIQTFRQMTGLPFMTQEEKQKLTMMGQQAAQQAQMTGGQPPAIPPEVEMGMKAPSWDEIVQVMKNDVAMHYKVDIETNSTIDAEASQDKQDIAELLNALSQFLNGVAPLVQEGMLPIEVAKAMLLTISRRFNFGSQLEDSLEKMAAPEPKGPDPAEQAKAEMVKTEAQVKSQELQQKAEIGKMEFENKKQLMALEIQIAQAELEIKKQELELQRQGLQMKAAAQSLQHKQKMEAVAMKASERKEPADAAV
jgi:hypothetical protein